MTEKIVEVERRGNGAMIVMTLLVLIVIGVGLYALTSMGSSESRKDDAVAAAAGKVGDAAQKAGDAVEK